MCVWGGGGWGGVRCIVSSLHTPYTFYPRRRGGGTVEGVRVCLTCVCVMCVMKSVLSSVNYKGYVMKSVLCSVSDKGYVMKSVRQRECVIKSVVKCV